MYKQIKFVCVVAIVFSILVVVLLQGVLPKLVAFSLEARVICNYISCSAVAFMILSGLCLLLRYIAINLDKGGK